MEAIRYGEGGDSKVLRWEKFI